MYPRSAFALLFSFAAIGLGIAIPLDPVDARCGPNADFLECGSACVATCANRKYMHPGPVCTQQCVQGCFCREGFLKNHEGKCVRVDECDGQTHPRLPFQIPSAVAVPTCPENEEFQSCGSACAPTCANPHPSPVCTKNCVVGCFCKEGHLRNGNGLCVPANLCEAPETSMLFAFPPNQCRENEVFLACGSACAPTCANPNPGPVCTLQCITGCFCKPGFLKNQDGLCVPANQCDAKVCGENEEYRQCKGCDGTCDNPNPICPRICIPGCACKQGHLRTEKNGQCVPKKECAMITHKCPNNEVFKTCGTACPATCADPNPSPVCTKNCVIGCFCQEGHLRNGNGDCVPAANCDAPKTILAALSAEPKCPNNEVFKTCGTACPATCADPNPSPACTKNCVIGCFCTEGHLRNGNGDCVPAANCEAPKTILAALSAEPKCPSERETYVKECGSQLDCVSSCHVVTFLVHGAPKIPRKCMLRNCAPACVCKHPYVRNEHGQCVERNQCDQPFTTQAPVTTH